MAQVWPNSKDVGKKNKTFTGAQASSSISRNYLGVRVRLHNQNIKQLNGIQPTFISTLSTSAFSNGKMSSVDRTPYNRIIYPFSAISTRNWLKVHAHS